MSIDNYSDQRIISPTCIGLATAFGGPAAGAMLAGCNSVMIRDSVIRAMLLMAFGVAASALIISTVVICQIPIPAAGMFFVAMGAAAAKVTERDYRRLQLNDPDAQLGCVSPLVIVPAIMVGSVVNAMIALPCLM